MQLDDYNGGCGPVQYRRSMSDEFVTYRDSHTFAWIGSMFALSVAWSVGALVVIGLNAAGIAFAVFGVAIGIVDLLYPFEAIRIATTAWFFIASEAHGASMSRTCGA